MRQPLGEDVTDHPFVGIIEIGMQQPHRDALITRFSHLVTECLDFRTIERNQYVTVCIDPFKYGQSLLPGQQRVGQDEVQIILLKPAFRPHLDHIAKALCGNQRGFCAAPFDQGVGGKGGAMDYLLNRRRWHACPLTHSVHAFNDGIFRGCVSRQHLNRGHALRRFKHDIRKRTADIDTQSKFHAHALPYSGH